MMDNLLNAVVFFYLKEYGISKIVIGKDARLMASVLAELALHKFTEAGVDVYMNGEPVSTCQFYYTCMKYGKCAGLMFTASHNPKQYIGVKLVAPGLAPVSMGSGLEKIKDIYEKKLKVDKAVHYGEHISIDEADNYISYCMNLAGVREGSLKGMNILFEFLCGSAGREIIRAFEKAGANCTARNKEPDGNFPMGDPNPLIESSVAPARQAMKNGSFDIGFCFDGDGDRMDIMARDGGQIPPSVNACMLLPQLLEIFKKLCKKFYVDTKAMPNACVEMNKAGCETHLICNGHAFIKRKLKENRKNGYFGAVEESAHYYLNFPVNQDDFNEGFAPVEFTLFFALLSAKCYMEHPEKYDEAIGLRNSVFRAREWTVCCENEPEKMPEILNAVKERLKNLGAICIDKMDDGSDLGADLLRINIPEKLTSGTDLSSSWVQVSQRISGSEDGLCRFEVVSGSEKLCFSINEEIKKTVEQYQLARL